MRSLDMRMGPRQQRSGLGASYFYASNIRGKLHNHLEAAPRIAKSCRGGQASTASPLFQNGLNRAEGLDKATELIELDLTLPISPASIIRIVRANPRFHASTMDLENSALGSSGHRRTHRHRRGGSLHSNVQATAQDQSGFSTPQRPNSAVAPLIQVNTRSQRAALRTETAEDECDGGDGDCDENDGIHTSRIDRISESFDSKDLRVAHIVWSDGSICVAHATHSHHACTTKAMMNFWASHQ
ncbi:hypothetical protein BDV96DRAFT_607722 [Lophiotrema nucula]|uniref:Uncharacterized protein n=1 Tax=Lophiotrema nucula TaxID=690887 RepID=A0A6A5YFK3_9PLEO|nr:hypothetical protein BDV96DRAFT_607722 [Lophiotrema nucula]